MIWALILLPVAWLLQNTIHEASHLFSAWFFFDRKGEGLWPYPHKYNGRFYFARCAWGGGPFAAMPGNVVWAAPLWGSSMVLIVAVSLLWAVPGGRWVFVPFIACSLFDIGFWVRGYFWGSRQCDGKRWKLGDERA